MMMLAIDDIVRRRLRTLDWFPDDLNAAELETETALVNMSVLAAE